MRVACRNAVLGAAALAVLLAFGGTANAASKCEAGKIKCVIKKKSCLLGLYAKQAKTGVAPDPLKSAPPLSPTPPNHLPRKSKMSWMLTRSSRFQSAV